MTQSTNAGAPDVPEWLKATDEDFASTDVSGPVRDAQTVDGVELSVLYKRAAEAAGTEQNGAAARVYAMLGSVCSFHFKPSTGPQ